MIFWFARIYLCKRLAKSELKLANWKLGFQFSIGDNTKADELYAELQMLAKETDYLYKKIEKTSWTLHKGNFGIKWETATVRKDIKSNSKSQGVEDI